MIEIILGGSFPGTFAEYGLLGFIIHFIIRFSLGNFEEEMGWRGFAQHRLQNKYSPLKMSLMIAIPHATWHLPMFLIEYGSIDLTNFLVYTIMVIFLTFIITWLYAKTESVFLAGLLHTTFNESSLFLSLSTNLGDIILLITVAIVGIILIRFFTPDKTSIEILDEYRASDNLTLETGL
jgi:membrane protease YdiL (CAAX protease family)